MDDRKAIVSSFSDQNFLTLGYRLKNGWTTSGTFDFSYSPSKRGLALMDPFVSVRKAGIVDKNGYRLSSQLRVYAPISPDAQAANLLGLSRLTVDQGYTRGRWTLGLTTYAQGYLYKASRAPGATRMKYLAEPSVSYQVSPKLTANLAYDMDIKNRYEQTWLEFGGETTYLIPSVSWSPTNWLSLEPSLVLSPGTRIATDTTTVSLAMNLMIL